MNALCTSVAHAFRRTALPLAAYYAVTLALPLANGATASGAAFVRHALVVLAVPPILIVVGCGLCAAANSGWSHIQRPPQQSSSSYVCLPRESPAPEPEERCRS